MSWIVAHFIRDNSVEVVPQTWINTKPNGTRECLWPPFTNKTKLYDAVQNRNSPQCDWKVYAINILGCFDTLEIAKRKCNKARETDDLSSSAAELLEKSDLRKRSRHIRKQKNLDNDYFYEFDSDKPKFPKSFLKHTSHNVDHNHSGTSEEHIMLENISLPTKKTFLRNANVEMFEENVHRSSNTVMEDISGIEALNGIDIKEMSSFINKSYEFQRQILKEVFLLKCILKENREMLELLIKSNINDTRESITTKENEKVIKDIMHKFPLRFLEDLEDIEMKLEDDENVDAVARELSLIGGGSIKEMTIKIMYAIISNKLASYYSWEGQKGKKVFKALKLATLVIKTIRFRNKTATDAEIIVRIKNWLAQAKFRENLKAKKREQRNLEAESERSLN